MLLDRLIGRVRREVSEVPPRRVTPQRVDFVGIIRYSPHARTAARIARDVMLRDV